MRIRKRAARASRHRVNARRQQRDLLVLFACLFLPRSPCSTSLAAGTTDHHRRRARAHQPTTKTTRRRGLRCSQSSICSRNIRIEVIARLRRKVSREALRTNEHTHTTPPATTSGYKARASSPHEHDINQEKRNEHKPSNQSVEQHDRRASNTTRCKRLSIAKICIRNHSATTSRQ
jgi:hypothetical protein